MAATEDDEYEIPLRDQRYFGAGIKRKRIKFVSSNSTQQSVHSLPTTPSQSAADAYRSIVLKRPNFDDERAASAPPPQDSANDEASVASCEICHRPVIRGEETRRHESSIAHQVCLQHSHPPSHIDRTRKGLAVLQDQGWDPDARLGLGVGGEGILQPIKAKENPERAGLGAHYAVVKRVQKPPKLDASKARLMEKEGKKKAERLREAFYRNENLEKYLGAEGDVNTALDTTAFERAKRR